MEFDFKEDNNGNCFRSESCSNTHQRDKNFHKNLMLGETSWIITRTWHEAGYGLLWMSSRFWLYACRKLDDHSFAVHSLYFWLCHLTMAQWNITGPGSWQVKFRLMSNPTVQCSFLGNACKNSGLQFEWKWLCLLLLCMLHCPSLVFVHPCM